MTFQDQMMKIVLPRLIDGLNNLKKEDTSLEERINKLEENVQELIKQVQELFAHSYLHTITVSSRCAAHTRKIRIFSLAKSIITDSARNFQYIVK